ncbi:haloacid dehalogenase superfamily protein [Senna tora]|uniref:Haloacid dehalogenase superfamily protein n=1 Tax=Senna tora TaxID=362788 RepID=A0A834W9W6_9FABA|nr:haloacid dehalogenase superfamily protein [Senna tora]
MPPTTAIPTVTPQLPTCSYLTPNHLKPHHHRRHHAHHNPNLTSLSLPSTNTHIPITNPHALTLPDPHNSINFNPNHSHNHPQSLQFLPSTDYNSPNNRSQDPRNQKQPQEDEQKGFERRVLFTNMWWADVKAALGQRINLEAVYSTFVFVKDPKLALPHISVPDMRYIDWGELRRRGFKGVVFDKDNTITAPYCLTPWPPLASSLERCKSEFGPDIAVFSNSAGLNEYDHDGSKAMALEEAIGIRVIRHRVKKPAGTAEEIEKHFGCESSRLIMVGDRPFTDIVYGNRNGFLTILTDPFSLTEEPLIVQQVRKLETSFINHWRQRGLRPPSHKLLPDPKLCVQEPPPR